MEAYQYRPLPPDRSEIRLVRLQPGPPTAALRIEIVYAKLSPKPVYEALSYVWGSPERTRALYVQEAVAQDEHKSLSKISKVLSHLKIKRNNKRHQIEATSSISQNLFDALYHLRSSTELRVLWIDAICINQDDLAERSAEVSEMGLIYVNAYQVIVWLGPSSHNSSLALQTLRRIGESVTSSQQQRFITPQAWSWPAKLQGNREALKSHVDCWFAIKDLLDREWFTRLWVFQEITLATSATLVVGEECLDWKISVNALRWIWMMLEQLNKAVGDLKLVDFGENQISSFLTMGCKHSLQSIFNVREATKELRCRDPLDRLYAIRGLVLLNQREIIIPDYSKSVEEGYKTFAKRWILDGDAILLTFCLLRDPYTGLDLPSWVPDWSDTDLPDACSFIGESSGASGVFATFNDDGSLSIQGVHVASLTQVAPPAEEHNTNADPLELCHLWMNIVSLSEEYVCGGTSIDAFIETITNGGLSERAPSNDTRFPTLKQIKAILVGSGGGNVDVDRFRRDLRSMSRGRAFFETAEGLFGIGPESARQGDCVAVILGYPSPLVLRPAVLLGRTCFRVVGACYVSGIMCAEALLGQLPSSWSWRWERLKELERPVFTNGYILTQQDPRMIPLPPAWRYRYGNSQAQQQMEAERLEDMAGQWFENMDTGVETWKDPRLTLELLNERGVAIEEFVLI